MSANGSSYIRAIFNVNQTNSNWGLAPRVASLFIPRGVGNEVSREFNLLYRFHSIQSENESIWVTKLIEGVFEGQDVPNLTPEQFFVGLITWMQKIPNEPLKRTVNHLVRNADGSYNDADLVAILQGAIDDPAGMYTVEERACLISLTLGEPQGASAPIISLRSSSPWKWQLSYKLGIGTLLL